MAAPGHLRRASNEHDATVKFGAVEGGNQTLDRLTEHLGKMA